MKKLNKSNKVILISSAALVVTSLTLSAALADTTPTPTPSSSSTKAPKV